MKAYMGASDPGYNNVHIMQSGDSGNTESLVANSAHFDFYLLTEKHCIRKLFLRVAVI